VRGSGSDSGDDLSERVGDLHVRARVTRRRLTAHVTWRDEVVFGEKVMTTATSVDQVLEAVRSWLIAVLNPPDDVGDGRRSE